MAGTDRVTSTIVLVEYTEAIQYERVTSVILLVEYDEDDGPRIQWF